MIDDDEKTARGGLGPPRAKAQPIVRSTAPAGTPARPADPASPYPGPGHASPSDRPVNALTPARTVGGHTARLNIDSIDTEPPPSSGPPIPPASRTAGGTMRMAPAPEIKPPEGAAAPRPLLRTLDDEAAPPPPRAPAAEPSRPRANPAQAPVAAAPAAPALAPAPALAFAPSIAGAPPTERMGSAWLTPLSAAVGLVFFAMGSMIALVIDGRLTRPRVAPAAEMASTSAPPAAKPSVAPVVPAAAPASAAAPAPSPSIGAAPQHTTAHPVTPAVPRPPHPPPPPPQQGRNPSRPPLPFPIK